MRLPTSRGGLSAVADAEFGQDRRDVVADRSGADGQLGRDVGIAVAVGDQREDFTFASAQSVWVRTDLGAAATTSAAAQPGEALPRAAGRSARAKAAKRGQCGFHRGDVAAELGDSRLVGATAPRQLLRGALPIAAYL